MKKRTKLIISTLFIVFSFWLGMKAEKEMSEIFDNREFIERTQIYSKKKMTSVYLKTDTRNYENPQIILTINSRLEFNPNTETDFLFKETRELIYKMNSDTLKIYCKKKPSIPIKFESEIIVKIIEVNNNEKWNLLIDKTKSEVELFN